MSRIPHKTAEINVIPGDVTPAHATMLAGELQANTVEQDMISMAMQDIGSLRALDFIRKISGRAQVEIYLRQVKTKAYKSVSYTNAEGETEKFPDIDTFCSAYLGESGRSLRSKAVNYHLLGAELFEVSERLGFKGKDYAALKALPAEDQEVIKQAMDPEVGRDQLIDLMQELAARHASEKAALSAKATEALETAASRDDVIGAKQAQISKLEVNLASAKRRQANFTDEEKCAYECAPLHDTISDAMVALAQMEVEVARLTSQVGGELVRTECEHALAMIAQRAIEISEIYRMPLDKDALLGDYAALELRAAGLSPEALQ